MMPPRGSPHHEARPWRVLVVDDEELNRCLIAAILGQRGYEIVHACDGAQALALVAHGDIDLVLLDVMMPGVDGIEVCRRIRQDHLLLPIVLISAVSDAKSRTLGKEAGADDFLGKPIHDAELVARTRNLLLIREYYAVGERLRCDAEIEAHRWRFIADVATAVTGCIGYDAVIAALAEQLGLEFAIQSAMYAELTPTGFAPCAIRPVRELPARIPWPSEMEPGMTVACLHAGQGDSMAAILGLANVVALPMFDRGAVVGVVFLARPAIFDGHELATLRALAPHVGNGIVNVRSHLAAVAELLSTENERKRTQAALRLSEERHRLLFEGSPLPIWVVDLQTDRVVAVNSAFVRLCRFDREALESMTTPDLFMLGPSPGDRGVARLQCRDGTVAELQVTSHTMMLDDVQVAVAVGVDVTQSRRVEEQLRQSQKMDAIGQLAGGVAHDFNNILAAILANAELALDELGAHSSVSAELNEIIGASRFGADVTRQLLAFSRKQRRPPHVFELDDCVARFNKLVVRLVGANVRVVSRLVGGGPINADPSQLEQLIMNLVVNARDAMPGGGELTIETDVADVDLQLAGQLGVAPGRFVTLAISDTGCGIDPAVVDRIFEPFFTTKEVGKGTGLGLAMVFGIVRETAGAISVKSEVGRGSTFRVYFPYSDSVPEHIIDLQSSPTARLGGSETILLVEDNNPLRSAMSRQLRSWGYRLIEARDGAHAVDVLDACADQIDLVITDLVMPGLDGRALAEHITTNRLAVKVLFMSGYADHAAVTKSADRPELFLEKPFTSGRLSQMIARALTRGVAKPDGSPPAARAGAAG